MNEATMRPVTTCRDPFNQDLEQHMRAMVLQIEERVEKHNKQQANSTLKNYVESNDREGTLADWAVRVFADYDSDYEDHNWVWVVAQNASSDPNFIDLARSDVGYQAGYSYAAGYRN